MNAFDAYSMLMVSTRDPTTACSVGRFHSPSVAVAKRNEVARAAIGFEHAEDRRRQRRQRLAAHDRARVGREQAHVEPVVLAHGVERAHQLRHAARLGRLPHFAALPLRQAGAVGHHHRQRAARIGGNLQRHRVHDFFAAIAAHQHFQRHRAAGARAHAVEPDALDRRGPRLLGGLNRQVDGLDLDRLEIVVEQERQRRHDRAGRAHRRAVARRTDPRS